MLVMLLKSLVFDLEDRGASGDRGHRVADRRPRARPARRAQAARRALGARRLVAVGDDVSRDTRWRSRVRAARRRAHAAAQREAGAAPGARAAAGRRRRERAAAARARDGRDVGARAL